MSASMNLIREGKVTSRGYGRVLEWMIGFPLFLITIYYTPYQTV